MSTHAAPSAVLRRALGGLAIGLCLLAASLPAGDAVAADAPSMEAQRSSLLALLKAYEPRYDAKTLHRIGPDVNSLLVEVAQSKSHYAVVRLRALAALRYYPTKQTKGVLMEMAYAPKLDVTTRRTALRALAQAFGAPMVGVLQGFLSNADRFMREAAIYGLGDIDDPRVDQILVDHEASEPEIVVRDAVERVLERRRKSRAASEGR